MHAERRERIATLADQFRNYLVDQTEMDLPAPGAVGTTHGPAAVRDAFEQLDAALAYLADLASVYGDDSRGMLEPLVIPTAALAGEYLCYFGDAVWLTPDDDDPDQDTALALAIGGIAIELPGVVRAALLSGAPNLTAVALRLGIPDPEKTPEEDAADDAE